MRRDPCDGTKNSIGHKPAPRRYAKRLIEILVSGPDGCFCLRTPLLDISVNGAGDAIAALFFFHLLKSGSAAEALSKATSSIFGVLKQTRSGGSRNTDCLGPRGACESFAHIQASSSCVTPDEIRVEDIEGLTHEPQPWPWANQNRTRIDEHFQRQLATKKIWNGLFEKAFNTRQEIGAGRKTEVAEAAGQRG